jgi:antagonist of KipI
MLAAPFAAAPAALSALPAFAAMSKPGTAPFAASAPPAMLADRPADPTPIRILRGDRFGGFDPSSREALFAEPYVVSPQSDRMGYRLDGPSLRLDIPRELLSEAVMPGAIQVPPDGRPIILMADCQTTGGYPIIGHVIAADLPLTAQLPMGSRLYFREVTVEEAQRAYVLMDNRIRLLGQTVRARYFSNVSASHIAAKTDA